MAEKVTKKELKQPDRFQIFLSSILHFLMKHKKKLIWGASALMVFLVIIAGWWYYNYDQEMRAMDLYSKAVDAYHQGVMEKKDLKEAAKLYRDVTIRYPHTWAASLAYFRLGNLYIREGKPEEGIQCLKKYIERNKKDNELLVIAYNSLGLCYEQKGALREALEAYKQASQLKTGRMFESTSYANIARVYEALNEKKKAAEYYEKARDKAVDPVLKDWYARKVTNQ